jgi:hypothetical protein
MIHPLLILQWWAQAYAATAMAIAQYFRRVDIFLTITCKPNWEEITCKLLPGQTAYD